MICGICFEPIYFIHYSSNQCKCKVQYHYSCINNWYKTNNCCVLCKKKDNTNIELKISKIYYILNNIFIIILITVFYGFIIIMSNNKN